MSAQDRESKIDLYRQAYGLLAAALPRFPREMWQFRPAPELWTIHEIVVHIADSEANSFVRLRRLVAEPGTAVMAYDEMGWARRLDYHAQSPEDALELFRWLRHNSAELLRAQPESVWSHTIAHPENGWMTMDDWLDVYARHIPDHIEQMAAVYAAWREAPGKSLA